MKSVLGDILLIELSIYGSASGGLSLTVLTRDGSSSPVLQVSSSPGRSVVLVTFL